MLLGGLVKSDWFPIEGHVWWNWGFAELRLASAAAVISVAAPELIRPVRIVATWLVVLGAVGVIAFKGALPSGSLGGLSLGLGLRRSSGSCSGQRQRCLRSIRCGASSLHSASR